MLSLYDERGHISDFDEASCPCTIELNNTRMISVKADHSGNFKGFAL